MTGKIIESHPHAHREPVILRQGSSVSAGDGETELYVKRITVRTVHFETVPARRELVVPMGAIEEIPLCRGAFGKGASIEITQIREREQEAEGYIWNWLIGH